MNNLQDWGVFMQTIGLLKEVSFTYGLDIVEAMSVMLTDLQGDRRKRLAVIFSWIPNVWRDT